LPQASQRHRSPSKEDIKRHIRQQSEWETPNRTFYIVEFEEFRKYLIRNKKDIILLDNSLDLHKNLMFQRNF
jgi:hypothetical protein